MLLTAMPLFFLACNEDPGPDQPPPFVDVSLMATATPTIPPPALSRIDLPPQSAPTPTPIPPTPTPTPVPEVKAQAPAPASYGSGNVVTTYLEVMYEAEAAHGLPRGLIAAMYIRESGGYEYNCPAFNCTGIGQNSAQGLYRFSSYEEGIAYTASLFASYPDPDVVGKLCRWQNGGRTNPCSYAHEVLSLMARYQ